jgi:hypothetical protein
MKTVVSQIVVALWFVALGSVSWVASAWERRTARADEALVTLRYEEPATQYASLENTMRPARRSRTAAIKPSSHGTPRAGRMVFSRLAYWVAGSS